MVIFVEDEKKILDALLDDDESFIVKKRRKEEGRIDDIVKQVRESIRKRAIDEDEERRVQIKRLERIRESIEKSVEVPKIEKEVRRVEVAEHPFLSDVEINVLKAVAKYGANLRLVARKTGYPEIVVSKAVEKLIEKGYLDENLNITEKGVPLVGIPSEEKNIVVRIIDVAIIVTAIVLILSTLYYFGYI